MYSEGKPMTGSVIIETAESLTKITDKCTFPEGINTKITYKN
jgi:hypothetical protein